MLLAIAINFSIVLSAYRKPQKCPCTNVYRSDYERDNIATCSCWICLNKEYEPHKLHLYQVQGLLGGQARYLGDQKEPRKALFINTDTKECPTIDRTSVYWNFEPFKSKQEGAWGKWITHEGSIDRSKKERYIPVKYVKWQYPKTIEKIGTSLERPLPAIGMLPDDEWYQYQSMLQWAEWSEDPCSGKKVKMGKRGKTRFAVCTYCFCISFLL